MQISTKTWRNYIEQMSRISQKAVDEMQAWISKHGFSDDQALLEYAYALSAHYGDAIGALACQMYEATALAQGVVVEAAEAAAVPEFAEVARAVHGTMKTSNNLVPQTIGRLVKRTGADTKLKNARRDGAQFAWIPSGDTCAFCLTLASRGWQYMSKKTLKNGHAEHIHANCDCQYAIRFDGESSVEGYDPDALLEKYESFDGTPQEKIRQWQKEFREANKDEINARKRELYARRSGLKKVESSSTMKLEKQKMINFFAGPTKDKVVPAELAHWIGDNKYEKLMSIVEGPEAKSYVRTAYRKSSIIGDGGAIDIRRFERETGLMMGRNGNSHETKIINLVQQVEKSLKKEMSDSDRRYLEQELVKLKGVL